MNKYLLIIIGAMALMVASGGTGYYTGLFYGRQDGRLAVKVEQRAAEAAKQKTTEAARGAAQKYLLALKKANYSEAHNQTCKKFKEAVPEQTFVSFWENLVKTLGERDVVIKDFTLEDLSVLNGAAKAWVKEIDMSPGTGEFSRLELLELKKPNSDWCASPRAEDYR